MRVACLLLAAGEGARFGGCKQLAPLAGQPMILHSLARLRPLFGADLYCVLGAHAAQIRPLLPRQVQVVEHRDWEQGMGSTIAAGVKAISQQADYDGLMIALADQVSLSEADYRQLLTAFDGTRIVAASYAGRQAVPALFPAAFFAALSALQGDVGARQLLRQQADQLTAIALPQAAVDIDQPSDLLAFENRQS